MIYIYNKHGWKDAKFLAATLNELNYPAKATKKVELLTNAQLVINWGYRNPLNKGLNANIIGNKLTELEKFKAAGLRTVEFSTDKQESWLARTLKHKAGNDLLSNLEQGDYYVKKIDNIKHEFRVHVFKGRSIRTGIKLPNDEAIIPAPHPWIRSVKRGWWIDYGQACQDNITKGIRNVAKKAVAALGYDFGAVDIALLTTGKALVFEVNSAPGLSNKNTALAYAKHIINTLE